MKSAQVFSRVRSTSNDTGGGSIRLDDDVCSLNSWSDDISHIDLNRSQSESRSNSSSDSNSNCVGEFKYNSEEKDLCTRKNKYGESELQKRTRSSAGHGFVSCEEIPKLSSSSVSMAMGSGHKAIGCRSFSEKIHDRDKIFNHSKQSTIPHPPSMDLKSASFVYPTLYDNSQLPSQTEENQPPTTVIKNIDAEDEHSQFSKPNDLSLLYSPNRSTQRLYPNLEELKTSCDETLYPSQPSNQNFHFNNSFSKSNISPTRPHFFDFQRGGRPKIQKPIPRGTPLSQLRNSSDVRTSATGGETTQPHSSASQISSPLYFKSQPTIVTQQAAVSLRQNCSSNDIESMNKPILEHRLEPDNVKSKMMSVWNNIKYGWTFKSKSNIKLDSPLFLLGKVYHKRNDDDEEPEFLQDFTSRIWLTYRNNFYPIPGTKLSTDCGWGCMLRSGQMLIAQCFINHFLGREWRIQNHQSETQFSYYKEILRWFCDPVEAPSDTVPFCLHHLVSFGRRYNKVPGEWYGPASVAYIFRDALTRASLSIPILKDLCVYVAQDCTVYIEDINRLCRTRPKTGSGSETIDQSNPGYSISDLNAQTTSQIGSGGYNTPWCRSLIILIPVRLGGESMNEIYGPCIKSLLSYNNCMGIIGGKPRHSLYFIGWQDDKLIYLDPHYCRETVDASNKDFSIETFHCVSPRKLSINKMDPSCTVGFHIRSADEFKKFVHDVTEFVSPPKQKGLYPLFIFNNGSQEDAELAHGQMGTEQGRVKVRHYFVDENGQRHRTVTRESEEFIML